jgi:hypothetical protein
VIFAKRLFLIAGIYGIIVVSPMYFFENQIGVDFPPSITHPEYFYGFIGVTLAWQILFLLIARDPIRYRLMMVPAIVEKATYCRVPEIPLISPGSKTSVTLSVMPISL